MPLPQTTAAPEDTWLLVGELEHRVANEYALAISSMSLAMARSSNPETKAALTDAAQRLRNYANAHRALQAPPTGGRSDLAVYLRQLCSAVARAALAERGIRLTLIEQSVELDAVRCWRVGLIVSELITNAARHALTGRDGAIVVRIAENQGTVHCSVTDNGHVGHRPAAGCGTRIIDALARELAGAIERRFTEFGAVIILSFPQHLNDSQ
jgi:two-component sensor histidine kinase